MGKYIIRKDIKKEGLLVPIGNKYIGKGIFNGKYVKDNFFIKYKNKWLKAYSIDFEFIENNNQ